MGFFPRFFFHDSEKRLSDGRRMARTLFFLNKGMLVFGTLTYSEGENGPEMYPLALSVTEREGHQIEGTVCWLTLDNATTRFRGELRGLTFTFEEYEVVSGAEHVVVPTKYTADWAENGIVTGRVLEGEPATLVLQCPPAAGTDAVESGFALRMDIRLADDGSERARVRWTDSTESTIVESVAVARRVGDDLVLTEISAEAPGEQASGRV